MRLEAYYCGTNIKISIMAQLKKKNMVVFTAKKSMENINTYYSQLYLVLHSMLPQ